MSGRYMFSTQSILHVLHSTCTRQKTMAVAFCLGFLFTLSAYNANGQSQAFPYSISVTTVQGKCYDDCRIIIKMFDDNGNEILVNPTTHNTMFPNLYPLYNIQYHYRNISAGTNIHYDTVNNIQVTNGTYCVGIIGHIPVTSPDGSLDYVLVDTSICNVEVTTDYEHMEASILSSQARNDYEWYWDENNPREFCGWRPSYSCDDRGRIQLKIIKGKFPYRVLILNELQDTVRNITFYQRQQSGWDSIFADFRDFYTFDSIPVGNYSIRVSDSCDYSLWLSINITATPINQSALAWEFGDFVGNGHCEGDSIHLAALPFAFDVAYLWTGPNGFTSTERINHIYLPYGSESGYYTLEVFNTGCSTQVMDSVYIAVIQAPRITILSDTTVCAGDGVTLAFQAQGSGPVTFDVVHAGAPASGSSTFTVSPGNTIYQYYPIESDNLFWPENISDYRCAYHHVIDTVLVSLFNSAVTASPIPNTVDGYACYNHTASLRASSNISTPYYVYWYQDTRQQSLLKCDTIYNASNYSTLFVNNVVGDTTFYVTVSNATQCAATYGALNHIVNMQNGTTLLLPGEGARLYDSGGELGHYGDNEILTHTFSCSGETRLDLAFNNVDIAIGDTLFVYAGASATANALLASLSNNSSINSLIVNQSAVTFRFKSNWTNNRDGWCIDIFTSVPMTPVSAHVSPLNYDTVAAVLCTSETPYPTLYFPPLDISQPTVYLTDTLFVSDDGCQTVVHLDIVVNPVSHTILQNSLMPCQLPTVWNGVSFSDYGTQNITFTNVFGCDSIVTMTLLWAPPVDSTFVYDTIVENQLPYQINGLTFDGPGEQIATLTTQDGCDSVVTVHLFVHYNVSAEADSIICDNNLPFQWNGVTFTQNDTQTVMLTAHTGADSLLTMRVYVNPTSLTTFTDTTCQYTAYSNYGFSLSESETQFAGLTTLRRTETNIYDCDSVIKLDLLITPVITPDFYAEPDKAILSENPDILFTNITNIDDLVGMGYSWVWDYGDGTIDTNNALQTDHLYMQWGDYTVTLTLSVNECVSEYSIPVIIEADLVFPNVITPNGDGINDVFVIKDMNPERSNRLVITDRWGKIVFEKENYETYMKDEQIYNPESGFGMGDDISAGVYFYTFYYGGAVRTIRFNGSITVIK